MSGQLRSGSPFFPPPQIGRQAVAALTQTIIRIHIHTHGQFKVTNEPNLTTVGLWEEAKYPERTHADTGRTYKLHGQRPQPGGEM